MPKSDLLDFDSLDTQAACERAYELELRHPANKKPLGVFVSVLGSESPAFKGEVRKEINRERLAEFKARRENKEADPKTVEEDEADSIRLASKLVTGWRTVTDGKSEPVVIWKGEKLDFNADNLNRWMAHFPWVRLQIVEASNALGNFMGN